MSDNQMVHFNLLALQASITQARLHLCTSRVSVCYAWCVCLGFTVTSHHDTVTVMPIKCMQKIVTQRMAHKGCHKRLRA